MIAPKPRLCCPLMICALLLVAGQFSAAEISIDATGDGWAETIDAADLQAGAGSDLVGAYESATDAGSLTISGTAGNDDAWRVEVRRTDSTNWHSNFILSVKRTGGGSGGGSITGGDAYQAIGTSDATFFSGAGDLSDIPLQFKLEGLSLKVPPDTYSTTITYTVVDIP